MQDKLQQFAKSISDTVCEQLYFSLSHDHLDYISISAVTQKAIRTEIEAAFASIFPLDDVRQAILDEKFTTFKNKDNIEVLTEMICGEFTLDIFREVRDERYSSNIYIYHYFLKNPMVSNWFQGNGITYLFSQALQLSKRAYLKNSLSSPQLTMDEPNAFFAKDRDFAFKGSLKQDFYNNTACRAKKITGAFMRALETFANNEQALNLMHNMSNIEHGCIKRLCETRGISALFKTTYTKTTNYQRYEKFALMNNYMHNHAGNSIAKLLPMTPDIATEYFVKKLSKKDIKAFICLNKNTWEHAEKMMEKDQKTYGIK